ncbi:DNA polymerase III subunit gamma/tau [Microbacterium sp. H1-D42]|uniref:DNA polymerase III subunit gamma/tau n=1 Tax=Microbacterium sp. H1-D42 TaxID=2925844 RepID=UPI001F53DBAE|nr:DNA polymerase III subunit gamma/tau [Microbacterium sp. H1-D42]UNK69464.1 DNA polymerase III subunit gamma/tau [Microbacterium sp. H1-D42]
MSSEPEDDALSWDGDDALEARRPTPRAQKAKPVAPRVETPSDPAFDAPIAPLPSAGAPASDTAAARVENAASAGDAASDADDEPQGIGTVALLGLGILGGIYLLYTVGWALGGAGMLSKAAFMMPAPMYQASMWIAVAAPALWFAAALVLTRESKPWVRFAALIVGALLLVPWPFVVAGGGGVL